VSGSKRLMTHLGVGALTALAFVLIIGQADRFQRAKQVTSYLGWYRWKSPVGIGDAWGTSPNKGVRCCAFFWSTRRRSQCAACPSGAKLLDTADIVRDAMLRQRAAPSLRAGLHIPVKTDSFQFL
jgi:hypothetical protein